MKIGMIGIGDIAKKAYLPVLTQTPGIELHICTRNEDTLQTLKHMYSQIHTYLSIDEWIESGIKGAFVHAATDAHEAIIDQLLDAGIHVYVDKPITADIKSTIRLVEKADQKGLLLMTGFNRRYAPSYHQLKDIKEPNMIIMQKNRGKQAGEIRSFIFDDFIHVLDTVLYVFPYKIDSITIRGIKRDDLLHQLNIQLDSKEATAIGIMNREAGTTEESLEVMSSEKTVRVFDVNETRHYQNKQISVQAMNDWQPTLEKRGFYQIIDAFLTELQKENQKPSIYEDSLLTHKLAEDIVRILEQGGDSINATISCNKEPLTEPRSKNRLVWDMFHYMIKCLRMGQIYLAERNND